ncbi:MAG: ECF transporter S component [Erysipelotrichia bacterium]|nr:ECF transporter S component [Erysipelotrichia bacterium]
MDFFIHGYSGFTAAIRCIHSWSGRRNLNMKQKKHLRRLVLAAFFAAVEVVLVLTPIGIIPVGPIRATTMHIPVILAGILCGPGFGAGIGTVFGLLSLAKNTFEPTVTSFVFSPFITIGGMHGSFWSLLIVLGPRIFMGALSGWLSVICRRMIGKKMLSDSIATAVSAMMHTLMVMGGIWLFFAEPYAAARELTIEAAGAAVMAVIGTNGVVEMLIAAVIVPLLVRALTPAGIRMGVIADENKAG